MVQLTVLILQAILLLATISILVQTGRAAVLPQNEDVSDTTGYTDTEADAKAFEFPTIDFAQLFEKIKEVVTQVIEEVVAEVFPNLIPTTQPPITEGIYI